MKALDITEDQHEIDDSLPPIVGEYPTQFGYKKMSAFMLKNEDSILLTCQNQEGHTTANILIDARDEEEIKMLFRLVDLMYGRIRSRRGEGNR